MECRRVATQNANSSDFLVHAVVALLEQKRPQFELMQGSAAIALFTMQELI